MSPSDRLQIRDAQAVRVVRMVAAAIVATALIHVATLSHAAVRAGSLRVKRVQARALESPALSLAISLQLSRAEAELPTRDAQPNDPERFRIHLIASGRRWRSGWIDAPQPAKQSMTCVIWLGDQDVPDEVRIAIVAADGRVLARKRWRRPTAPPESQPARFLRSRRVATASMGAAVPMGSPDPNGVTPMPPLESIPTLRLTWGELKMLYRETTPWLSSASPTP